MGSELLVSVAYLGVQCVIDRILRDFLGIQGWTQQGRPHQDAGLSDLYAPVLSIDPSDDQIPIVFNQSIIHQSTVAVH